MIRASLFVIALSGTLLTALGPLDGATITAKSVSLQDVRSAVDSARDGDAVVVPAGRASWTSVLSITKGIILQGATVVTNAGTAKATADDLTVIQDDSPLNTKSSGLIKAAPSPSKSFRLTGFTFTHGSRTTSNWVGTVHLTSVAGLKSPVTNVRVDHCHFDHIYGRNIQTDGWVYGVADHNWIVVQGNGQTFFINDGTYGGYTQGNGAWADYPWFGTDKFFFIEDNTLVGNGNVTSSGAIDSEYGGRFVVRHNYLHNAHVGWHGTEGGNRGCRAVEVYDNNWYWTIAPSQLHRSGTCLFHDNSWSGSSASHGPYHSTVQIYREFGAVGVNSAEGVADGTSPWDMNDTEGNGKYVEGHPPHLFERGTATGGTQSGSRATLTDSSKNWTVNQWAGFSVTQENPSAASYLKGSFIISNTATTLTYAYYPDTDRGPNLKFTSGDAYQIHRILVALDQFGRGKGDLLSGGTKANMMNAVSRTKQWPHQVLEPAFSWNNVYTPTDMAWGFNAGAIPTEVAGRDYYNLGKGFTADSTPSQVSSIYTASLNGVAYSGTYQYPHPLVSGVPATAKNMGED